jgi:hypothetical protein
MDLRRYVQGLITPDAQPYQRPGGLLLVPGQSVSTSAPQNQFKQFTVEFSPGIEERPVWPFEEWALTTFAIPYAFELEIPGLLGAIEEGSIEIDFSLGLVVDGLPAWSFEISKAARYPKTAFGQPIRVTAAGTAYANLSQPIPVRGGNRIQLVAEGAVPQSALLAFLAPERKVTITLPPFRIPYTVEGG